MTAAGYPVDFTTIARWKRQDWRANSNEDHPLDEVRARLEAIAPLATGEPTVGEANNENGQEQVTDAALLRRESQKLSTLSTQVWNATEPHLRKLVRSRTGELALLVQALAETGRAATDALSQAEKMEQAPPLAEAARHS
jgi:hypothetical protein